MHKMNSLRKISIFSLIFFINVFECLGSRESADSSSGQEKPPRCGPYEVYKCGSACQTECTRLGQSCPNETKACNWGCYCDCGYARDYNGRCVLIKECPNLPLLTCDRRFEHYACGSACQVECKNYGQVCPIINIKCNEDCYCDDGYARDENGACIPVWQCPEFNGPKKCEGRNEHYEKGEGCEKHCDLLNDPCIPLTTFDGCYCNTGYARDHEGVCIPVEKCPPRPCEPRDDDSDDDDDDYDHEDSDDHDDHDDHDDNSDNGDGSFHEDSS